MSRDIHPSPSLRFGSQYEAPEYRNAFNQSYKVKLPSCDFTSYPISYTDMVQMTLGLMEQNRILHMDVEKLFERVNELETEKATSESLPREVEQEVERVLDSHLQNYLKEQLKEMAMEVQYRLQDEMEGLRID